MNTCVSCKSRRLEEFITVNGFKILKCMNCKILFTNTDRNNNKSNNDFYNDDYIKGYALRREELINRFTNHLEKIEKFKPGGKILDIGCGMGYFLEAAKKSKNVKWEIYGLELNKSLRNRANKQVKRQIIAGKMSSLPFKDRIFDCVTCFDVLEHDVNLETNLEEIYRVLKNDGVLVVQAPNYISAMAYICGSSWDWWWPPDHVLHLSYNFLRKTLIKKKFKILSSFTYENSHDFISNIKGLFRKNYYYKLLFYLLKPLFMTIQKVNTLLNIGALSFIVAKKGAS